MSNFMSLINDRSDLSKILTDAMEASYKRFTDDARSEYEGNLLKSYIIEAHDISDGREELQLGLSAIKQIAKTTNSRIVKTDDPSLVGLVSDKLFAEFVIDLLHPRYWFIHTLSKSNHADRFLTHIIKGAPFIDRAWFHSRILEEASRLGRFEGLGIRFDSTIYHSKDLDLHTTSEVDKWDPLDNRLISLNLKTLRGVRQQLQKLRDAQVFPYASALSWVRVRTMNGSTDTFALEDVTYSGKFTARGTSFTDHVHFLIAIRDNYEASIIQVEENAAIGISRQQDGFRFHGSPIVFGFSKPILNMDEIIPRMFTSAEPYRLWGIPRIVNEKLVRIHAVDLHVGQSLTLEITPNHLVAYLPQGSCGNSIARIFSNVQRTLDPEIIIEGEESWLAPRQVISN